MTKFYDQLSGRILNKRPEAYILSEVFDSEYFFKLKESFALIKENNVLPYNSDLGRYGINTIDKDAGSDALNGAFDMITLKARSIFGQDVKPTYALWVTYKGFKANLPRHIDDNACTYTIDLCVSHDVQWPIYIEGKELLLEPNQAAVYYGEVEVRVGRHVVGAVEIERQVRSFRQRNLLVAHHVAEVGTAATEGVAEQIL